MYINRETTDYLLISWLVCTQFKLQVIHYPTGLITPAPCQLPLKFKGCCVLLLNCRLEETKLMLNAKPPKLMNAGYILT